MNTNTRTHVAGLRVLVGALLLLASAWAGEAKAQSTWTGTSGTNWSVSGNWNGTAPTSSGTRSLVFDGVNNLTSFNDLTSFTLSGLTFNSGAGEFNLSGNAVTLTNNVTNNATSGTQTIGFAMASASSRTFTGASGATTRFNGVLSGAGQPTFSGSGHTVILGANNTFTALPIVNLSGGELVLASANAIPVVSATTSSRVQLNAGKLSLATSSTTGGFVLGGGAAGTTASIDTGAHTLTIRRGDTNTSAGLIYMGSTSNANGATVAGRIYFDTPSTVSLEVRDSSAATDDLTVTADLSLAPTATTFFRSGFGTLVLSGSNSGGTGFTIQNAGLTKFMSEFALPGGTGTSGIFITQQGGVTGLGAADLVRRLSSSGVGRITISGTTGFAAYNGNRNVSLLDNTTGLLQSIPGNSTTFAPAILVLGAADSIHAIDFKNPVSMDTAAGGREVRVDSPAIYPQIMSGAISGSSTSYLRKTGAGTLLLSASNSLSGTTQIFAGTLRLGGAAGALNPAGVVTGSAGATLSFERSSTITQGTDFPAGITGGIGISQVGTGTTALSGVNTFTGDTTITSGVLSFNGISALQDTAGVSIAGGAGLTYSGGAASFGKNITVTSGTGTVRNSGGGLLALGGTLSKNGTVLRLADGSFNVTGQIVGARLPTATSSSTTPPSRSPMPTATTARRSSTTPARSLSASPMRFRATRWSPSATQAAPAGS